MLLSSLYPSFFLIFVESTCNGLLIQNVPMPDQYVDLQAKINSFNATIQALTSRINKLEKYPNAILQNEVHEMNSSVQTLTASTKQLEQRMMMAPVAFLAELGKTITNPSPGNPLVFDVVHLNDGNAYSNVHGIFTAPVSGLYHFTLELTRTPSAGGVYIRMMKSSTIVGYVYLEGNPTYHKKRSATSTLHLSHGDDVWVKVTDLQGSAQVLGCCYHSIFSGFLIKAD